MDASGDEKWSKDFLGNIYSGISSDQCTGLLVDAEGNAYVSGSTTVLGSSNAAYVMMKYLPGGNREWTSIKTPDAESPMRAAGLALANGYVLMTGSSRVAETFKYRFSTYRWAVSQL
jgi:hypothetical protein